MKVKYTIIGSGLGDPELREDNGEIEAALSSIPNLVEGSSIRGALHNHTTASDGQKHTRNG